MVLPFETTDVLERITDAFIVLNKEWRYVYANRRAGEITRRLPEDLIGKNIWEEFPEAINSLSYSSFQKAMQEQQYVTYSEYYEPLSLWMEAHVYPSPNGISVLISDITDKKRTEEKLVKANTLYSFISRINQTIIRVNNESELFAEVCNIAVTTGRFHMAWIGMLSDVTKDIIIPVAFAGKEDGYLSKIKNIKITDVPEGRGPTGTAVRDDAPVICNDIENDLKMKPWKDEALARGYRSSIAIPLRKSGKAVGAFTIYAVENFYFKKEETELLIEVASDISFTLETFEKEKARKQAEEALAKSERQYHTLTEISPVGIFHTRSDGYTTYVNPRWSAISGLPADKAIGSGWLDGVHPEDRNSLLQGWQQAIKKESISLSEYRFVRPDKSIAWVLGQAIPERDQEGKIIGYVGTITDITNRKKAEQALKMNEQQLKLIYASVYDPIFLLSVEKGYRFRFVSVNDSFLKTIGLTEEQIVNKYADEIIPPASFAIVREKYMEAIRLNKTVQWEEVSSYPAGIKTGIVSITPAFDHHGNCNRLVGTVHDITERKKAAEEIERKEKRFSNTLDKMLEGVQLYDFDWRCIYVNEAVSKQGPYSREEIMGKRLMDNYPDIEGTELFRIFEECKKENIYKHIEHEFTFPDGLKRFFELSIQPNPEGIFILSMDITERKKIEREIIKEKVLSDSIINSLPGVFYLYTREGKFIRWNRNFEIITGYSGEEIVAMHPLDFFDGNDKEQIRSKIEQVFLNGSADAEAKFLTRNKEEIPYFFTGQCIELGGKPCLMGVGIDFSERARAQAIIKKNSEELHELTTHLLNIREEERKRIGREIHDELGQQLTAIKMDIAWIDKKIPDETPVLKNKVRNIIHLLDGSNQSIRRILSELRPGVLDDHDLLGAIEWLSRQFTTNTSIPLEFSTDDDKIKPGEQIATNVFRIYQEALTNIIRYSKASAVLTSLNYKNGCIVLEVHDNGIGFDTSSVKTNGSFGILGMRERIRSMNGTLEINSAPGNGTRITVSIPFNH